jgi:predicted ATP-dependent protease
LSGLPLKQGIAVTGSVDQQGNVQPIGGVNDKIEGFLETCGNRGLTGEQGVIVPAQNVINLMLCAEARQAVADGMFHIYPVRTVDEGIAILTGVSAGTLQEDGSYPENSVHGKVVARLQQIAESLKGEEGSEEEQPADESLEEDGDTELKGGSQP